ncbi:MAG: DUF2892 domain-containing protein [Gemmatimonadota bacterium]
MKCNVGGADRTARIVLGVVLVVLNLAGILSGLVALIAWIVAAIAIVTAFVRFCPANAMLGINSCSKAEEAP